MLKENNIMKKVLIVDDSAFMRGYLRDLLTSTSCGDVPCLADTVEFFEADGKEKAIQATQLIQPDVILLDIVMKNGETEGLEFIEEIKDHYNPHKIIMISSIKQPFFINKCKQLGVMSYLQKPVEQKQFIEAVNQHFNSGL